MLNYALKIIYTNKHDDIKMKRPPIQNYSIGAYSALITHMIWHKISKCNKVLRDKRMREHLMTNMKLKIQEIE